MYRHILGDRWRRRRLALAAVVAAAAMLLALAPQARALECAGVDVDDGCLFTITGGDTVDPNDGFAVTNAVRVPMWDFVRDRDAQDIGYPISQRWVDGPFTLQAFQKVILQWDPGKQRMNYYNTLDVLANRYPDVELPLVPAHQVLEADRGADFATITRNHLALLDQHAAIKDRFLSEPDWLNLYGLPIRYTEREIDGQAGAVQMLRAQRTVFVVWNVAAPGTTVGRVNLQNVPDKVKKLSNVIIPDAAKAPVTRRAVIDGAQALRTLASRSQVVFEAVLGKSWVRDGISAEEFSVIWTMSGMARSDEARALSVLQMPFLETVEAPDHLVASFLDSFPRDPSLVSFLHQVLSHPTLSGGIRDEHVDVLAALLGAAAHSDQEARGALYSTLFDPEAIIVEQRTISLPLTGDVLLVTIRTRGGAASSMDWLERSLRSHEAFMGVPLPGNYVSLLVADVGGAATRRALLRIPDSIDDPAGIVAHEAGHVYWWGSPTRERWMAEGGASLLEWIALGKGPPIHDFRIGVDSCETVRNLTELEQETGSTIGTRSICQYRLGFRVFYDLYTALGEEEFRRGFRQLHLKLDRRYIEQECMGEDASLCSMRFGFVTSASDPAAAATASDVINRWYYAPQDAAQ